MSKRTGQKVKVIVGLFLCFGVVCTVFFNISYSKTRTEFKDITNRLLSGADSAKGVFTEQDIVDLPLPVQNYFRYCGYIGTPKMSYMKAVYQDVDFSFGRDKSTVRIDYVQYNFVHEPNRIAYIDSSMYGIPFEGLDSFIDGDGSMKGVLAKLFTLFDQTGEVMDEASLVTCLSECLIVPNMVLQEYITWEEIDELHAKATITCYGITASGIFAFNENGAMISFTTNDRTAVNPDGTSEKIKWSAVLGEYRETNGVKKPTSLQAIWHYPEGDLIYFDGKNVVIEQYT